MVFIAAELVDKAVGSDFSSCFSCFIPLTRQRLSEVSGEEGWVVKYKFSLPPSQGIWNSPGRNGSKDKEWQADHHPLLHSDQSDRSTCQGGPVAMVRQWR